MTFILKTLCSKSNIIIITFQKQLVLELINLENKFNIIYSTFAKKLNLFITQIDIKTYKIDGILLGI